MRIHRIGPVLRADLTRIRTQPLFFVWAVVLVLFAWLFGQGNLSISAGDSTAGGVRAWVTSEFAMAHVFGIGTLLFHGFFVSVVCGLPIVRDTEARIGPILHTTGLRRSEYVAAKLLGALLPCLGMLALHVALSVLFNHVWPTGKPAIRGPLNLLAYVRPALFIALPTVVFMAGAAFTLGSRSGRAVTAFVLPVGLFLLSAFVIWEWAPADLSVARGRALMLLDPTGYRWLHQTYLEVDRGVAFYNHAPVHYDLGFLLSRLGWMALGLSGAIWIARRPAVSKPPRPSTDAASHVPEAPIASRAVDLSALGMRTGRRSITRATWQLCVAELRSLKSHAGLYLFIPVILVAVLPGALTDKGPFDSALLPTPGQLAQETMGSLLTCSVLLLLFYTVESLERDARTRIEPLLHASPTPPSAFVLGRLLANLVLGCLILGIAWIGCLIIMVVHKSPSRSPVPFLLLWGACGLPTLILWTAFVGAVWTRIRSRYWTYAAGMGVIMGTGWLFVKGKATWLTNWALWKSLVWSDISVLENDRRMILCSRLFALLLAVFFVRLAVAFFTIQRQDPLSSGRPRSRWRGGLRMAPFWMPPLLLGSAIFGCVETGHGGQAARDKEKDYWKQNVATFDNAPSPQLTFVDLDVDLAPEQQSMQISGTYTVQNLTGAPLRQVLLTVGPHMRDLSFEMNGAKASPENRSGLHVFTPDPALAVGQTMTLGFSYRARFPDGASKNGGRARQFILPSGVMLTNLEPTFVPVLGFVRGMGVDEDNQAEARVYAPDFYEGTNPPAMPGTGSAFQTRIRIHTPADMQANSVGNRTDEVVRDGRRITLWETSEPVRIFNIVCGRWDKAEGDGVEVYYDRRHGMNVPELVLALESARRHYDEWFSPYPWKTLKLTEFPGLDRYAQGFPTNITFSENIGFLADPGSEDHLPFWITAHEAAHQWWPNLVMPADGPGSPVLSEGMSHFSAMLLLEAVKGEQARQGLARRLEHGYAKTRVADAEQPLVRVDAEGERKGLRTVWYDRGGWAMWMLMQSMGREEMFRGLHAFVETYQHNPDHPTLHDYFVTLRPFAKDPAAFDDAVHTWFEEVSLPQFQLVDVHASRRGSGAIVTGWLENAGTGTVWVDVAARSAKGGGALQERQRVRVGPGQRAALRLETAFEPREVIVDPDVHVLQIGRKGASLDL